MINKVILVGNVGADPEVRALEGGAKVARLRIATTERFYNRESQQTTEHTEWHNVTLWRGLADVADKYVRKGARLYIEGRLRTREWTDKEGNKRYSTEILADELKMLDRRGDAPGATPPEYAATPRSPQTSPAPSAAPEAPIEEADDLPF